MQYGQGHLIQSEPTPAWRAAMRFLARADARFQASFSMTQLRKGI